MDLHPLSRITAAIEALGAPPLVAIVAPGHTGELVAAGLRRAGAGVIRMARADAQRDGALRERLGGRNDRRIVVVDAQWGDPPSLMEILDRITPVLGLDDGVGTASTIVLVSRTASAGPLARIHQLTRRAGLLVGLAPTTVDELVGLGASADEATDLVTRTGGLADLLEAIELDGSLGPEVARRLSATGESARQIAELLAFGGDPLDLPQLVDLTTAELDDALVHLVEEGIVDGHHRMVDGVAEAVRRSATPARRAATVDALRELGRPGGLDELAAVLDGLGDRSGLAGQLHLELAGHHARLDPRRALDHVAAARACGVATPELRAVEAAAALADGDPHHALRLLAQAADPESELLRGAAWAAAGDLGAAGAALTRSEVPVLASWALLGVGEGAGATASTDAATVVPAPAQTAADAADALRVGLERWVHGERHLAEELLDSAVRRYAVEPAPERWPVTPHLVQALVVARAGDPTAAARTVQDALALDAGGRPHRRAHVLVSAWLAARLGHLDDAGNALAALDGMTLTPQEEVWRAAVRCAIAVRGAEGDGLARCTADAAASLRAIGPHLYDLDLVGEIAAAVVRLASSGGPAAESGAGSDPLDRIERAIERLGAPAGFRFDLAWARLRAALAGDDLALVAARADELLRLGEPPRPLDAVRRAAEVLRAPSIGAEDAPMVEQIARDLATIGCAFEAARMCGVVALAVDDETTARRLLKESRTWRATRARLRSTGHVDRSVVRLSDQEVKVAQLVVEGMTHKQIGSALFISAKTVEHHVAHIRTKLGAGSRAELLAAVRDYLADEGPLVGSSPS